MYRVIIVLQSVSVPCVQCHYYTAVCVSVVYTGSILYCSLCQCVVYRVIIVLNSLSV
jgi:hypothetical protein